jgi:hypothetical protein
LEIGDYFLTPSIGYRSGSYSIRGVESLPFRLGPNEVVDGDIGHITDITETGVLIELAAGRSFKYLDLALGLDYGMVLSQKSRSYSKIYYPSQVLFPNNKKLDLHEEKSEDVLSDLLALKLSAAKSFPMGKHLSFRPEADIFYGFREMNIMDDINSVDQWSFSLSIGIEYNFENNTIEEDSLITTTATPSPDLTPNIEFDAPPVRFEYSATYSLNNAQYYIGKRFGERRKGEGLIILDIPEGKVGFGTNVSAVGSHIENAEIRQLSDYTSRKPKLELDTLNASVDLDMKGVTIRSPLSKLGQMLYEIRLDISGEGLKGERGFNISLPELMENIPRHTDFSYGLYSGDTIDLEEVQGFTIFAMDKEEMRNLKSQYPMTDFIAMIPESGVAVLADRVLAEYPEFEKIVIILE